MFLCLHKKKKLRYLRNLSKYDNICIPARPISDFWLFWLCPVFIHTTQNSDIVYSIVDDDYTSNPEITRQK